MVACSLPGQTPSMIRVGSALVAQAYTQFDQGPLNPSTPLRNLMIVLQPSAERHAALLALLADQQNPRSPEYHKWLTPEQFGARFGSGDIDSVTEWLRLNGMTDIATGKGRMVVSFSGTADTVSRVFHTEIHAFNVRGTPHFANISSPAIPSPLAHAVAAIVGLTDLTVKPQVVRARLQYESGGNSFTSLAPGDLAVIYDLNSLYADGVTGKGVTVAIVGRANSNTLLSDYRSYRQTFGLPANDFNTVTAYGSSTGSSDPDDILEASLDLQVIGAVARDANILYVWGDSVDAATAWVIDNALAQVISESYAGCEVQYATMPETLALQANAEGITWVAAAGDSGAAGCDLPGQSQSAEGLYVEAPANAPSVTSVGGTTLNNGPDWNVQNGSGGATATGYMGESGWNSPSTVKGGGGGVSRIYGKPGYQSDFLPDITTGRMTPDVSFSASPGFAPYYIVANGKVEYLGGTSAGTPLFSGILALVNQFTGANGLGNVNPVLYRLEETSAASFHDIVDGSNEVPCASSVTGCSSGMLGYASALGYDLATGLGSVDASRLAANWASATFTPSSATLDLSSSQVAATQNVTLTAHVQTAAGPLAGSPVQFYLANHSQMCNLSNMTLLKTIPTDQSGVAQFTLDYMPAGVSTVYAYATGKTSVAPAAPESAAITITSNPTTTAIQASAGPYRVGQSVGIAIQVTPPAGVPFFPPNPNPFFSFPGQVVLYSANGTMQSFPTAVGQDGAAAISTKPLVAGDNVFYAIYEGDCYLASSQSSQITLTTSDSVPLVSTATHLSASSPEISINGTVTLIAKVTASSGNAIPTGAVTMLQNGMPVGTVPLDATATASFSYTFLGAMSVQYVASYGGDANYSASTSAPVSVTASAAPPADFTLQAPESVALQAGASATVNIGITPLNGFNQTIQLTCSGLPVGVACSVPTTLTPSAQTSFPLTISAIGAQLAAPLGALVMLFVTGRRRKRTLFFFLAVAAVAALTGCGGRPAAVANSGLPAATTYTATVTATSGTIKHQCQVRVIVSQ